MLLVKDNRPKAQRKLFPVYFKCPEKVILEYTSVVYTKDWLGRVRKHSKNNVNPVMQSQKIFEFFPQIHKRHAL